MTLRPAPSRTPRRVRRHSRRPAMPVRAGRGPLRVPLGSGRRPGPVYRPAGRPPRAAGSALRSWPWALVAVLLAAGAVTAVVVRSLHQHHVACPPASSEIIWAQQVTAEEGDSPDPPAALVDQADQLAACGEGQLIMLRGAGQGGAQAGPAVSLRIYREPGELENDPTARQDKVQDLVGQAFKTAQASRPPGAGRDVIGLLASISSELGHGENDVWLQTLGLPTVNPADARTLMSADPAQAVASIARWIPSLHGARVRLVLSPPAGSEPRFNTATDAWRRQFMVALLRQAGADVVSVTEVESVQSPAPGAPPAPVIPNLPEPTPQLPKPRPGKAYTARLDSSTLFVPNSPQFLSSQSHVLEELQPIITGWREGMFARVLVVGHCARFGPPAGALRLSQQRAAKVAGLLRLQGVSVVTAEGVGYSQPLPPNPQSATNRVVIVTAYPKS
jgi:outer membrane protein OmpA-like peptidoglycan-associated protein